MLDSGFLHGGCLNEVGNLYGGSEMVARVGEAIKEEMVLERMEEDKKDEGEKKKREVVLGWEGRRLLISKKTFSAALELVSS
jgi:hypothetical protein